tara:strand:- start:42 stop:437 length:396 start_codon:yes stop_codon:yes gene_type:complete
MKNQPVEELLRLYKEDPSQFTLQQKSPSYREVNFYNWVLGHPVSGVTFLFEEICKSFTPTGDTQDTTYLISCANFDLQKEENTILLAFIKEEVAMWKKKVEYHSASNVERRRINKLLGVNKTNKFKWWWNK